MKLILALSAALAVTMFSPARAAEPTPDLGTASAVAVIVWVPTPPGISREKLVSLFIQSVPEYRRVPGLLRKYYTADEAHFGGMYLFVDRAAGERYFSAAWHERVKAAYGADGTVTFVDAPVQITGGNAAPPSTR